MGVFERPSKKTKSGKTYYVSFMLDGKQVKLKAAPTKREAENILSIIEELLRKRKYGEPIPPEKYKDASPEHRRLLRRLGFSIPTDDSMTLNELADVYLRRHSSSKLSEDKDERLFRLHIRPALGHYTLSEIDQGMVEDHLANRLKAGIARASRNKERALLHHVFRKAVEWGYTSSNPVHGIPLIREDNRVERHVTPDEVSRLLKAAEEPVRSILLLAMHTGLRKSELKRLQLENVSDSVTVTRAKSGKPRVIPLTETAKGIIERFRRGRTIGPVFLPEDWKGFDYRFQKARSKAGGMDDVRCYDATRHLFGSRLGEHYGDPAVIRDLLGHSSLVVTDRYMKSRAHRAAVETLEKELSLNSLIPGSSQKPEGKENGDR